MSRSSTIAASFSLVHHRLYLILNGASEATRSATLILSKSNDNVGFVHQDDMKRRFRVLGVRENDQIKGTPCHDRNAPIFS